MLDEFRADRVLEGEPYEGGVAAVVPDAGALAADHCFLFVAEFLHGSHAVSSAQHERLHEGRGHSRFAFDDDELLHRGPHRDVEGACRDHDGHDAGFVALQVFRDHLRCLQGAGHCLHVGEAVWYVVPFGDESDTVLYCEFSGFGHSIPLRLVTHRKGNASQCCTLHATLVGGCDNKEPGAIPSARPQPHRPALWHGGFLQCVHGG